MVDGLAGFRCISRQFGDDEPAEAPRMTSQVQEVMNEAGSESEWIHSV